MLLIVVLVGGLWMYADARSRAVSGRYKWFDSSGVMHTVNPYSRPDKTLLKVAIAQAELSDEIEE